MSDDFFSDFDSVATSSVKKMNQRQSVDNPFLHADEHAQVTAITADFLTEKQVQYVKRLFDSLNIKFNLIFPFSFVPTESDLKKSITKFFIDNVRKDLADYVPSNLPIVTFGRGLYTVTYDTDIQVDMFYDTVFNKPYIYTPQFNTRVYPCDSLFRILGFGQPDKKTGDPIILWDQWESFFAKEQIKRAGSAGDCSLSRVPQIKIVDLKDPNAFFQTVIDHGADPDWHNVAFDTETGGLDPLSDPIGCVTMSFDGKTAYYMDWKDVSIPLFEKMMKGKYKILANGKFDILFFAFHGTERLYIDWDTMIGGHMLNEMRSNSLKTHAWYYTPYGGYDLELEKVKMKYKGLQSYLHIPKPIRMPYAAKDAAVTWLVWKGQYEEMSRDPQLLKYYETYAIGMVNVFSKAEFHGFPVDWDKVTETGIILDQKIHEAKQKVLEAFKVKELNIGSKKQLGEFIESLGWPCVARVKASIGGYYKVSKTEIHEWIKQGHNEAKTLLEYSKWISIKSTFIGDDEYDATDDSEERENPDKDNDFFDEQDERKSVNATGLWQHRRIDGRVHATFHTFMCASHRNRSSNPNFQNLPKKNWDVAAFVRACYTPPKEIKSTREEADLIKIYDQNFGCRIFGSTELVLVNRNGQKIRVEARDLQEEDSLCA